jgi:hypothetical protein
MVDGSSKEGGREWPPELRRRLGRVYAILMRLPDPRPGRKTPGAPPMGLSVRDRVQRGPVG